MPGKSTSVIGNIVLSQLVQPVITPVAVLTVATAEQTFTVGGLQVGDFINYQLIAPLVAGLSVIGMRVTAANTLGITFVNTTGGSLTPTANNYIINVDRFDAVGTSLPAVLV